MQQRTLQQNFPVGAGWLLCVTCVTLKYIILSSLTWSPRNQTVKCWWGCDPVVVSVHGGAELKSKKKRTGCGWSTCHHIGEETIWQRLGKRTNLSYYTVVYWWTKNGNRWVGEKLEAILSDTHMKTTGKTLGQYCTLVQHVQPLRDKKTWRSTINHWRLQYQLHLFCYMNMNNTLYRQQAYTMASWCVGRRKLIIDYNLFLNL